MNMKIELVNRARYAAGFLKEDGDEGMQFLSKDDKNSDDPKKKDLYELCKSLYLPAFLGALSEVPWTMGRRRKRLLKTTLPHGHSGYRFVYGLPYDCARPVELSGKGFYVIDGDFLCTDTEKAELLYVSNGRFIPQDTVFEPVSVTGYAEGKYDLVLSPGHVGEWDIPPDFTVSFEGLLSGVNAEEEPESDEDYPEYMPPQYEPKFYEFLEMMLAAKFAVSNREQPRLHDTLMQKAMLIKQEAVKSTMSIVTAKQEPSTWWADRLGIHMDF